MASNFERKAASDSARLNPFEVERARVVVAAVAESAPAAPCGTQKKLVQMRTAKGKRRVARSAGIQELESIMGMVLQQILEMFGRGFPVNGFVRLFSELIV